MTARRQRQGVGRFVGGAIALLGLFVLALPGVAGATSAPYSAVSDANIQISSYSASAKGVTYTVNFRSTDPLPASSTITLAAPAGTVWPEEAHQIYSVIDDATESGVLATNGAAVSGPTLTLTTDEPVAPGDLVTVLVNAAANPTTNGAKTLDLSTSADPTAVGLEYTLSAKRAVTNASVTLSSSSARAKDVTYSFTFVSPDRLTSQWTTAVVSFPAGAVLPGPGDAYQCTTPLDSGGACNGDGVQVSGVTATLGIGPANPGQVFSIVVAGVANPTGAGSISMKLSTNADPKSVDLDATLASTRAVTHPFLQLSSYTPSETGVLWSVGFKSPDRLTGGFSTITLQAPSGTVFPAAGACDVGYTFVDPGAEDATNCLSEQVTGSTVVITVPTTTSPGDIVSVEIAGVTNPASGSLQVSTSSDPAAVTLPLTNAHATVPAAVQLTSTSERATGVTYIASFALAGNLTDTSTITLSAPGDTVFPSGPCNSEEYFVYDLTTGEDAGGCNAAAGSTVTISQELSASAGDEFAVVANDVSNPTTLTGSQTLTVTTSSGGSATPSYSLTAPTSVGSVLLQRTSTSASATGSSYIVTFQAANGLVPDWTETTLRGPSGTEFPTGNCISDEYTFFDLTTDRSAAACPPSAAGSTAVIISGTGDGFWAAPGDLVTVLSNNVINPSSAGNDKLKVSTGGDPIAVSTPDTLTAETAVKSPVLALSSYSAGASGVTYSVSFQATNGLALGWTTVTLAFPAGTGLSDADFAIYNDTTGSISNGGAQLTGTKAVITSGVSAAAGDEMTVIVTPTTNTGAGSVKLKLSTGSDRKVTKIHFTLS